MRRVLYPLGGIASVVSFLSLVTAAGEARGWAGLGLLGAALAAPLAIAVRCSLSSSRKMRPPVARRKS